MALLTNLSVHSMVWTVLLGLAIVLVFTFLRKAWRARQYMRGLQKQGLVSRPN
jgi:hypothetical protein